MSTNKLAEHLGIDPQVAAEIGQRVVVDTFFSKLASRGIEPENMSEAESMLQHAVMLDQIQTKQASAQRAGVVGDAFAIIRRAASKQAGAPQIDNLAIEASQITESFLEDPTIYGAALIGVAGSK